MSTNQWFVVLTDAGASAVLLFAAVAKLAAPAPLGRALLSLTRNGRLSSSYVVRAIGGLEAAIALAALVQPIRTPASALLALLGMAFVALGIVGRRRGVDEPCGCFGAASQQPLGTQNIVLGALIAAVALVNLTAGVDPSSDARAAAPLVTAALLGLASLATWRVVMRPHPDSLELS